MHSVSSEEDKLIEFQKKVLEAMRFLISCLAFIFFCQIIEAICNFSQQCQQAACLTGQYLKNWHPDEKRLICWLVKCKRWFQ